MLIENNTIGKREKPSEKTTPETTSETTSETTPKTTLETTADRYLRLRKEVDVVCKDAGRDPKDVLLLAVSKTVDIDEVKRAISAGAHDFGENRPDEILRKSQALPQENWHFIGNIQSRRISDIVNSSCLVHSLYQIHHVAHFERAAQAANKIQDVLLEVNISGEESKSGISAADVHELLEACLACEHIRVRGLMTMAPIGSAEVARECFCGLAKLHAQLKSELDASSVQHFNELSMGMSQDWQEGVRAGATIVRIGRAVFSPTFA